MLALPQLFVVALVAGVLTVFFDVAYQSYMPVLVEPDQLVDANGKIGASQSFGQVAGPSFGGALVGTIGAAAAVVVDALSFLAVGDPHDRHPSARARADHPDTPRVG